MSCLAALGVFFLRLLVVAIVGRSRIALISWSASLISVIARVEVLPGQLPVNGIDDHGHCHLLGWPGPEVWLEFPEASFCPQCFSGFPPHIQQGHSNWLFFHDLAPDF